MRLPYTAGDAVSSPNCHDMVGLAMIRLLMIEDDGAIAEMVVNYIIT